ncbi:MAG: alanine--tRNA ligase [Candidatus Aenigmarchaeota archaeon]|nr:alanine--tRNA ligase [Candidatus Aenigmarchaeota archaeon]
MFTKDSLKKEFEKDWKKQYQVELFKREGFERKKCENCGKYFWTLDSEKRKCGDPPCDNYGFIGEPVTKKSLNYVDMWKAFERFFVKNGHMAVSRYPVVDRWRPDLFFTIASIQDFQRIDNGKIVMEYPGDPLIVPQVCLRFPDIANVGVTGRHHTSFIMGGQHSFGNYWKDRCIDLNFGFLNGVLGIPKEKMVYIESVWSMPDFSQFGPSLETISLGLELVNSVFSQFTKTGSTYRELPQKVIDVGWGHERLVWFSQGTHTGYEAAFGPVIKWIKRETGFRGSELFDRYSTLAGGLDFDEVKNVKAARDEIAKRLGVSVSEINKVVEPMQALYAITDHIKTLLFAVSDGAIPSNVGGGYNLRVLLRRSFSFIEEFGFGFDLVEMAELHSRFLKPLFPELEENIGSLSDIIDVERERHKKTMDKAKSLVARILEKGKPTEGDIVKLYVSNGVTPELFKKAGEKMGKKINIAEGFYGKITDKHMTEDNKKKERIDVSGIKETGMLFYDDPYRREFHAKVLKTIGEWVVLDQTLFYPEGGGQPHDMGTINGKEVKEVRKTEGVILHRVKGEFKPGQSVKGELNWERRYQLMKMHTATHLVSGAARKLLGKHVWQAGAQKGIDVSRIDLTHYNPFTRRELEDIEKIANEMVKKQKKVFKKLMDRSEAEREYGFVLYQGGASPGKKVRVVKIPEKGEIFDVEACGGTHLDNTKEVGSIKIIKSERVQDGVNRIEFTAGEKVGELKGKEMVIYENMIKTMEEIAEVERKENVSRELHECSVLFSVPVDQLERTVEKFVKEIDLAGLKKARADSLRRGCEIMFDTWKKQKKSRDRKLRDGAGSNAESLLKKAKNDRIFEIVDMDRKEMIKTADSIIGDDPKMTVILVSRKGDVVGMSKTTDIVREVRDLCEKHGGSGGGRDHFAQGRLDFRKLKI